MARKVKVEIFENGKPLESAVACTWTAFLNGNWTKNRPTRPGKYIIANRAGRVVGEVFVFFDAETEELAIRIRDGALCKLREFESRGIWWWSSPMPLLMPIPVPVDYVNPPTKEDMWGGPEEMAGRRKLRQLRDTGEISATPSGRPCLSVVGDDATN